MGATTSCERGARHRVSDNDDGNDDGDYNGHVLCAPGRRHGRCMSTPEVGASCERGVGRHFPGDDSDDYGQQ